MKTILTLMAAWMLASTLAVAGGGGKAEKGYTLLVIPRNYTTVQLGHDLADREKILLLAYETVGTQESTFLHAWTGERWVVIPEGRFLDGSFARKSPIRSIVVGAANDKTSELISGASVWSPEVLNVESADTADLVNNIGRILKFSDREWEWYAARYQLKLEDLNQEARETSWYDQNNPATVQQSFEGDEVFVEESLPAAPVEDDAETLYFD